MAVSYYDHHKHGFYLLMNAALPGFTHKEQLTIASLVRAHRKSKLSFGGMDALFSEAERDNIEKLAALLRLAGYLERSKAQRIHNLHCHLANNYVQIELYSQDDIGLELQESRANSQLFRKAFGVDVDFIHHRS